jgi:hypothetical protein
MGYLLLRFETHLAADERGRLLYHARGRGVAGGHARSRSPLEFVGPSAAELGEQRIVL